VRFLAYNSPITVWLRPDPLGELERSPRPPSRKTGGLLLRGGEGREGERTGGKARREGEGEGPPNANSWIHPCLLILRKLFMSKICLAYSMPVSPFRTYLALKLTVLEKYFKN